MLQPTILVMEARPHWAPELQRQFLEEEITVRECRRVADIDGKVGPETVAILLQFDDAPADCLQFLGRRIGGTAEIPVVVLGTRHSAELEWTLRDLGAFDFLIEPIGGTDLARICRRLCRPVESTTPATLR